MKKIRVGLGIALLCAFLLLCYHVLAAMTDGFVPWNQYATADITYADGHTEHFDSNLFGIVNRGDRVVLNVSLPQSAKVEGGCLCFVVYNSTVHASFEGRELYGYGDEVDAAGDMIGGVYPQILIPEEAWGKELTIVVNVRENDAFSKIESFSMYTAQTAYRFFFDNNVLAYIISIFGLTACAVLIVLTVVSAIAFRLGSSRGIYLLMFVTALSLWIFTNCGAYNLIAPSNNWTQIEYVCLYILPAPGCMFTRAAVVDRRLRRILLGMAVLDFAFMAVAYVLNVTNVLHFCSLLMASHVLLAITLILLLVASLSNMRHHVVSGKYMMIGICAMVGITAIDLLRFYVSKYVESFRAEHLPSILSLGMLVFVIFFVVSYISDGYEQRKKVIAERNDFQQMVRLLHSIPAGICVFRQETLAILDANDTFYQIMGYQGENAKESGIHSIGDLLVPEEVDSARKQLESAKIPGQSVFETEINVPNGENGNRRLLVRCCTREETNDVIANVVDITKREEMENELMVREADLRTSVEISGKYYYRYDVASRTITYLCDTSSLFGVARTTANYLDSISGDDTISPESIRDYTQAIDAIDAGEKSGDFVLCVRSGKWGTMRWFSHHYKTIFDRDGKPLHAIVCFEDITDYREKEIAFNMHRKQIMSMPEKRVSYFEYNLTKDACEYAYGSGLVQPGEAYKQKWDELMQGDVLPNIKEIDRVRMQEFLRRAHLLEIFHHGNTNVAEEFHFSRGMGGEHWMRISVDMTADAFTGDIKVYCLYEDIDEEKSAQLEQAADQRISRYYRDAYEKLSSTVLCGLSKYKNDEAHTLIFANDIYYAMHGYSSEAAAQKDGFVGPQTLIRKSENPKLDNGMRKVAAGELGRYDVEYQQVNAAGETRWLLCSIEYDSANDIFNTSTIDITKRKAAETELKLLEQEYLVVIHLSDRYAILYDIAARGASQLPGLKSMFPAADIAAGFPESVVLSGTVENGSVEVFRELFQAIARGEKSGAAFIHMKAPDNGALRWYRLEFETIFDDSACPVRAILSAYDVTEQREYEQAYQRLQQTIRDSSPQMFKAFETNLTRRTLEKSSGEAFAFPPPGMAATDLLSGMGSYVTKDYQEKFRAFLDPERQINCYRHGLQADVMELTMADVGGNPIWYSLSVQLVADTFTGDVKSYVLFSNVDEAKKKELKTAFDIEKLEKELENSRIRTMINQMQPHFLYNALSAIRTIVKHDPDYAYDLLYDFATHLRGSIKALSSDELIPFSDELKNIQAYLNIEKMRFGDELTICYDIAVADFYIVPLSIQPLTENATRHGIRERGDAGGTVTVRTRDLRDEYLVEVEDDGVGFDVGDVMAHSTNSYGLKNLIFRLKTLMDATVAIDSTVGKGTRVTVRIPKKRGNTHEDNSGR